MPNPATLPTVRNHAHNLLKLLREFDENATSDAQNDIAAGYADYSIANVKESFKRAEGLLKKEHYKICVAGTFSSGKSTFINALLGEKDLLATAAGECTMSITLVMAPGPGEPERVVIDYFNRDEAIYNVVHHQKFYRNAFKVFQKELEGGGSDQMVATIKKVITWLPGAHKDMTLDEELREEFSEEKAPTYAAELVEFLGALDKYADRLGRSHVDSIENSRQYLTIDNEKKGLGHLFLIEKVYMYRRNRLFVEEGLQIVDTPGTDSPSPRQRQVTHNFLQEADVVITMLEPRGFTWANMEIIETMTRANLGNIRNKMFFIINKFDTMDASSYKKADFETLMTKDFVGQIVRNKISPKHIYPMVAIVDIEKLKGNTSEVDNLLKLCGGRLKDMDPTTMEPWYTKAKDALTGHGVEVMRENLIKYLKEELAFERVRDIQRALKGPLEAALKLVNSNAVLIQEARSNRTNALGEIRAFIEKTQQSFEVHLTQLGSGLPTIIKNVVTNQLKKQVVDFVGMFNKIKLGDPAEQIKFAGSTAKLQNSSGIKQFWIDYTKQSFSDKFVDIVHQAIVGNVQSLIDTQVKAANVEKILDVVQGELAKNLRRSIERSKQNVDVITRLRADESTWELRNAAISPQGMGTWTPTEETNFKAEMVKNYTQAFSGFCDKLGPVLGLYYQVIIRDLIKGFKDDADEFEKALKQMDVSALPTHLLAGGDADPKEVRRRRLLTYADLADKAKVTADELTASLT